MKYQKRVIPLQRSETQSSFLLYLLAFLLFWEWLRPLTVISNTSRIDYFIGFAGFAFLLSYLRLPIWITFPSKGFALLYALHMLFFYNTPLISGLWIDYFLQDLKINTVFLFEGNWVGLTNLFRSFLFFILLWIVSYLMHFWLIQTRKLFLFFFMTLIYLTVVDTFTMYHADMAIVRTLIIGLVLLGLLRILNIQERERVAFEKGPFPLKWIRPLILMIGLSLLVGLVAPKPQPQWPDPVPFITKAANGYGDETSQGASGAKGGQTIGYDSDDTHLGGTFHMDDTPIFTTVGEHSHYWIVATKDEYTGKGWVVHNGAGTESLDPRDLSQYPEFTPFEKGTKTETETDSVSYHGQTFPQLIYGSGILSVDASEMDTLEWNKKTGELKPLNNGRFVTLKNYLVKFQYPTFSVPLLKKVTDASADPEAIKTRYLQLPENLPERIRKLSETITKSANNRYDKANAIVNYFKSGDFHYETSNIPVPGKGVDYVDQFLFETKRGYCDNFSTAMAVMLRTIGIPSRWVKGFTQGEYKDTLGNNRYEYTIRNSNAHSWVEVYFPGSGWVPFEPTIGFDNITSFNYADSSAAEEKTPPPAKKPDKPKQTPKKTMAEQDTTHPSLFSKINLKVLYVIFACMAGVALILGIFLYRTRKKWLPGYTLRRFKHQTDASTLELAAKRLLKLLSLYGYVKKPHQTLREFASIVDRGLGTDDMKKFTLVYERGRYHRSATEDWLESKQYWENIINKLRG